MIVRDYMSYPPVTIRSDDTDYTALRLMQDHAIHHIPVVTADGQLVGILAKHDLLLTASRYLLAEMGIEEVMRRDVVTATLDMPLVQAATLMLTHGVGCLPVVDLSQQVVGIITEGDLHRVLIEVISSL
jgi:acetoin utilization protein AcuB